MDICMHAHMQKYASMINYIYPCAYKSQAVNKLNNSFHNRHTFICFNRFKQLHNFKYVSILNYQSTD